MKVKTFCEIFEEFPTIVRSLRHMMRRIIAWGQKKWNVGTQLLFIVIKTIRRK